MILVLRSDFKKENQENLTKKIKKWIAKGKILSTKSWGKRELSYPINKEKEGVYLFLELEFDGLKKGGEIERRLRLEENVLRHLLLRKD